MIWPLNVLFLNGSLIGHGIPQSKMEHLERVLCDVPAAMLFGYITSIKIQQSEL